MKSAVKKMYRNRLHQTDNCFGKSRSNKTQRLLAVTKLQKISITIVVVMAVLLLPSSAEDKGLMIETFKELSKELTLHLKSEKSQEHELLALKKFIEETQNLPNQSKTEIVPGVTAFQLLTAIKHFGNIERTSEIVDQFSANGNDAVMAMRTIYNRMDDTEKMLIHHLEALDYGANEIFANLKADPDFDLLDDADLHEYRDMIFTAFIKGEYDDTTAELLRYAPHFSQYVFALIDNFPFSEKYKSGFSTEFQIAQENAKQDAGRLIIAQENAKQLALDAESAALDALIKRLKDATNN